MPGSRDACSPRSVSWPLDAPKQAPEPTCVSPPRILHASVISQTRIFRIEELELAFPNGVRTHYERLRGVQGEGAVLMTPMLDQATVLLVREYAAGTERYELGLPKGRIEQGEDRLEAANRELMEEIDYGARRLHQLMSLPLAPGYIGSTTHVILAEDLYPPRLRGDEPEEIEVIEVVPWRLDRLDKLLQREDCSEARRIAALYSVRDHRDRQP
jgi:ADP-ribose diphosphatase